MGRKEQDLTGVILHRGGCARQAGAPQDPDAHWIQLPATWIRLSPAPRHAHHRPLYADSPDPGAPQGPDRQRRGTVMRGAGGRWRRSDAGEGGGATARGEGGGAAARG